MHIILSTAALGLPQWTPSREQKPPRRFLSDCCEKKCKSGVTRDAGHVAQAGWDRSRWPESSSYIILSHRVARSHRCRLHWTRMSDGLSCRLPAHNQLRDPTQSPESRSPSDRRTNIGAPSHGIVRDSSRSAIAEPNRATRLELESCKMTRNMTRSRTEH
jgi:hypothetical protein